MTGIADRTNEGAVAHRAKLCPEVLSSLNRDGQFTVSVAFGACSIGDVSRYAI